MSVVFIKTFYKVLTFALLCVLPLEVAAEGIWAVNKLFQVIHKGGAADLEHFSVTVKQDLACFH